MKDKKVLLALGLLLALVGFLIFLTLQRKYEDLSRDVKVDSLTNELQNLGKKVIELQSMKAVDGKTPIRGVDYTDGLPGKDGKDGVGRDGKDGSPGKNGESAYDLAVKNGFKGTLQEWLDSLKGTPAPEIDIQCVSNILMKKYSGDDFWQPTNSKCEARS